MIDPTDTKSPEQAEAAFYAAFENGDLEAMAKIWARSEDIVCVHPHGPPLLGYDQVMKSWQNILDNAAGFRINVRVLNQINDGETSVTFVNETLINEAGDTRPVTVLATNAYQRTESGWRIVLHHASPAPQTGEEAADDDTASPGSQVTLH